jgi:hypothetical protein
MSLNFCTESVLQLQFYCWTHPIPLGWFSGLVGFPTRQTDKISKLLVFWDWGAAQREGAWKRERERERERERDVCWIHARVDRALWHTCSLTFYYGSQTIFGVSIESMQCAFDSRGNSVPVILLLMQEQLYQRGGLKVGLYQFPHCFEKEGC